MLALTKAKLLRGFTHQKAVFLNNMTMGQKELVLFAIGQPGPFARFQ
jgi:hypothetical protein